MKKLTKALVLSAAVLCGSLLTSCATPMPVGCLYTKITLPVTLGSGKIEWNKKAEARCISICGWVAAGDASINAACKNGGIKRVSFVNQKVTNILGIYGTYTTVVYGFAE